MNRLRYLIGLSSLVLTALAACGGSTPKSSSSKCQTGDTRTCLGPGACQGAQVCLADHSGFGPCNCGSAGGASGSAGSSTSGGSASGGSAGSSASGGSAGNGTGGTGGNDAGNAGAGGGANGCAGAYTRTTIAGMRQGNPGCFELYNVVAIALTPSTQSPQLYVQDASGGDYSAMRTSCSSTSTAHPCSVSAQVAAIPVSDSVTIKGTYANSGYEAFYIDSITDNGAGTRPTPPNVTLTDISRSGTNKALTFQRVTAMLTSQDSLVMYDWTPSEFTASGATQCPYQTGFGMISMMASATPTAACTSGTAQPVGQSSPDAAEVLIGTDFYKGFTVSSDCRCAKAASDQVPSAGSQITGSISGVLDVPDGAPASYAYIAPTSNSDAAVTATVPGM